MLSLSQMLLSLPMARAGFALVDVGSGAGLALPAGRRVVLHYVLQGSLMIEAGAGAQRLSAGDFACLPRGHAHRMSAVDAAEDAIVPSRILTRLKPADEVRRVRAGATAAPLAARLLGGVFASPGAAAPWPGPLTPQLLVTRAGDGGLSSMPPPALIEEAFGGSGGGAFAFGLMRMLLLQAVRAEVVGRRGDAVPEFLNNDANRITRAQALIEGRFRDPWTVASLAASVGLSRSSFAARFAAATGESPMAALGAIRFREARRLLVQGRGGVSEIGQAVGYASADTFARAFRKHHGETPLAYRQRRRQEVAPA